MKKGILKHILEFILEKGLSNAKHVIKVLRH
jgi:hypothetical protein